MARIFISYKRADKDKVFRIKSIIEKEIGENCWIDINGIESDATFKSVIINAINQAEVILFMYSKEHLRITNPGKDWTIKELSYAESKNKRIVFINIDGSRLSDEFCFDYGSKQQLSGQSNDDILRLIDDLRNWLCIPIDHHTTSTVIEQRPLAVTSKSTGTKNTSVALPIQSLNSVKDTQTNGVTRSVKSPIKTTRNTNTKKTKNHLNRKIFYIAFSLFFFFVVFGAYYSYIRFVVNYDISTDGLNYSMIKVKGGTYCIGMPDSIEDKYNLAKPMHNVTLNTFYIGKTEVTQDIWKIIMGFNPSIIQGDRLPVTNVSWSECQEFLRKLNEKTGRHYRLPTEAEWEFAAKGGNNSENYLYSGSNAPQDIGWCACDSVNNIQEVATKKPNELGLYDMTGNVWEWCSDWCEKYEDGSIINPQGPQTGTWRAARGGAYCNHPDYCLNSFRGRWPITEKLFYLGFRIAISE